MNPAFWVRLVDAAPNIRYVKAEGTPQGVTLSETIRQSEGRLSVFCGWGGLGLLDALERGAAGSMPAMNFTRLFRDVQECYESGSITEAVNLFHRELPYIVWTMQSVDFSVKAAKEELRRRGVIESSHVRQPAAALDAISLGQLERWIAPRVEDSALRA
jgi:4-hydroxy-tetrahydrodipicolinate synthase